MWLWTRRTTTRARRGSRRQSMALLQDVALRSLGLRRSRPSSGLRARMRGPLRPTRASSRPPRIASSCLWSGDRDVAAAASERRKGHLLTCPLPSDAVVSVHIAPQSATSRAAEPRARLRFGLPQPVSSRSLGAGSREASPRRLLLCARRPCSAPPLPREPLEDAVLVDVGLGRGRALGSHVVAPSARESRRAPRRSSPSGTIRISAWIRSST